MPRALLIVNPFASRVDDERLARVEEALRARWELETVRTEGRGHAAELAREAGGRDALLVFSGDGGFNEALNGLRTELPVGFLPGGGTSVLPRALGLPRDPVAAARRVAEGRQRRISLGRVNGRRFAFSAGLGLDAEVVRRVDARGRRADGRRPGDLAFAAELARAILARRGRLEPALELRGLGRAAAVFVSNGAAYSYAGPLPLRFSRGSFEAGLDVAAPVRVGPAALAPLLARSLAGRGIDRRRGVLAASDLDRLEVVCDAPVPLQVDGEDLGDVTEAVFEAERDAVTVLV